MNFTKMRFTNRCYNLIEVVDVCHSLADPGDGASDTHSSLCPFLPPENEVWGKVMFLHVCVILFTGEGGEEAEGGSFCHVDPIIVSISLGLTNPSPEAASSKCFFKV